MAEIVLTTFNAKYAHCAFGLRYILANLDELKSKAKLIEFEISHRVTDAIETILAERPRPRIVGLGVYIWNIEQSTKFVAELKRVSPETVIVLGGPEVSYETERQRIVELADYVITGEGDLAFAALCGKLLADERPVEKIIAAQPPEVGKLAFPYELYDTDDIAHRVIYVEASRGCPFRCEFCLSSLEVPVRAFALDAFLGEMQKLLDRGVRQFKFVDRTFNLNIRTSRAILEFFLARYTDGLFIHFEMIPDNLPEALREVIAKFPPGALQFEVGVQSFNEEVCERISRRQNPRKVEENLTWLRENTGVHIHADLIAGLPGETLDSFAAGFDRLAALGPQEIQLGILKRLRGTPIARHDVTWDMVYSPNPPYEVLSTSVIDFATMQMLRRFAQCWDRVANSGRFLHTVPLICADGSYFRGFRGFSQWLYERVGRTHSIALPRLAELIGDYLVQQRGLDADQVRATLDADQQRWLAQRHGSAASRQARHLA